MIVKGIRGQSSVVGVVLLLGITVVSMGTLVAAIGVVVDSSAAEADAERVASDLDAALKPAAASGPRRSEVTFGDGQLHAVERTMKIRADGDVVERLAVDALVFESGDRRVVFHAGAILRENGNRAWMTRSPPITIDEDVLIVSAPRLGDDVDTISGTRGVTGTIETDVSHDRRELGQASFSIALETTEPDAWERQLRDHGAVTSREPGAPPTVVATFEGEQTGYLVIHDLDLEVRGDG